MSNVAEELTASVEAVACLGSSSADIDVLSDPDALAGQKQIADARRLLDTFAAWIAATLARRSRPELGDAGLAARQGFLGPEAMIQKMTGSTRGEAAKLVAVGIMMAETEAAEKLVQAAEDTRDSDSPDLDLPVLQPVLLPWQAPIARAITTGVLSVDAAESIRKGLGDVDTAVTAVKLAGALTRLLTEAPSLNADQLFRRARRMRDELDEAGIAAREKQCRDDRYWRVWRQRDGMVRINALLDPESGESVLSAYDQATSPRRGGPRFVDTKAAAWAEAIIHDERSTEQLTADTFVELLRIAGEADPGQVFGGRRPSVRVIVTEKALTEKARTEKNLSDKTGHGHLEGNPAPISWETIERHLCDTGTVGVKFDDDGQCVNVGREQRLFTTRQRIGIGVRDGGCIWPDCDRPPSWCEAHHVDHWKQDHGKTDIADGVLLCRRHHMILHNNHWHIRRDEGTYWLRPPVTVDPTQTLLPMPSKSPPMLEIYPDRRTG